MRARPALYAATLLAFLALPGCTTDPFGAGAAPGPDDVVVGKGPPDCGPPPIDGCTAAECRTGACGGDLVECDARSGKWKKVGYCEWWPPPATLAGTWTLTQTPRGDDPCPDVLRADEHVLVARPTGDGDYQLYAPDGTLLARAQVSQAADSVVARFSLDDTWSDGDQPLAARVDYLLLFYAPDSIAGDASASVPGAGGSCSYSFGVAGTLTAE